MDKKKVLIICGATATGKTKLALELAKKFNGDLIVADSMQVYRGMNVITGKDIPSKSIKHKAENTNLEYWKTEDGVRIWLTDLVEPQEEFSVGQWRRSAIEVIEKLWKEKKLPIAVGGTGLYIKSLTQNLETINIPQDKELRRELANRSADDLLILLTARDPVKAANLNLSDRKNPRRLIRAIEIAQNREVVKDKKIDADFLQIGLNLPLEKLFERIENRVDERIKVGALDEVSALLLGGVNWDSQSMTGLGYRQLKGYFEKSCTLDEAINLWKQEEKRYAKRQITWLKKEKDINWFDINAPDLEKKMEKLVANWYNI